MHYILNKYLLENDTIKDLLKFLIKVEINPGNFLPFIEQDFKSRNINSWEDNHSNIFLYIAAINLEENAFKLLLKYGARLEEDLIHINNKSKSNEIRETAKEYLKNPSSYVINAWGEDGYESANKILTKVRLYNNPEVHLDGNNLQNENNDQPQLEVLLDQEVNNKNNLNNNLVSNFLKIIHSTNLLIQMTNTAVDSIKPNSENCENFLIGTNYLAGAYYGNNIYSAALISYNVIKDISNKDYTKAFMTTINGVFNMNIGYILSYAYPANTCAVIGGVSLFTVYNSYLTISKINDFINEYSRDLYMQESKNIYCDLYYSLSNTYGQQIYDFTKLVGQCDDSLYNSYVRE